MAQDKIAKIVSQGVKGTAVMGLGGLIGFLFYNYITAEQRGR